MSRRDLHSYRWDGTQWAVVTSSLHSELEPRSFINTTANINNAMPIVEESIRVATLNILADCFPWFVEMVIRSSERLEWLCDGITNLNPTIIGLNEVTANALQRLQQCPFIRDNYFITKAFDEKDNDDVSQNRSHFNNSLFRHGCVILSKLPLLEAFAISVTGNNREVVVGKVQLGKHIETCVYFCAFHTTPHKSSKNVQLRAQQIRDVVDVLVPLKLPFVIMGDLNLYYALEDAVVIDNNLIDAWAQTHFSQKYPFNDQNPGYTFDSLKNTLIPYYIPGECKRMRLDRILFSRGFPASAIVPCNLWANEPIKSDHYLFPSDHFGLYIDLVVDRRDDVIKSEVITMSMRESDSSAEEILNKNAQNKEEQLEHRRGLVRTSLAWTSHAVWLGAVALGLK